MSFSVIPSDKFKREAKRLSRKFPSLKQELIELNDTLTNKPETGTPLGNDTYKIRFAVKSKSKGKSGGARVITYVIKENKEVYLLILYDKSEFDIVDDKTIKSIIQTLKVDQ